MYLDFKVEVPVSVRSGCLKVGAYLVIKKVMEYYRLDDEIKRVIGMKSGELAKQLSMVTG